MISLIEQILRWSILVFAFYSLYQILLSYSSKYMCAYYFTRMGKILRRAYIAGNLGIIFHAALNLWVQYERTGYIFVPIVF